VLALRLPSLCTRSVLITWPSQVQPHRQLLHEGTLAYVLPAPRRGERNCLLLVCNDGVLLAHEKKVRLFPDNHLPVLTRLHQSLLGRPQIPEFKYQCFLMWESGLRIEPSISGFQLIDSQRTLSFIVSETGARDEWLQQLRRTQEARLQQLAASEEGKAKARPVARPWYSALLCCSGSDES
jgi:hypothetical protein